MIVISEDRTSATISGRELKSIWKKLNPIWWLLNDDEQTVAEAPWYQPDRPLWLRTVMWNIRNPLQNFRAYVVGVQDRNYTVTSKPPVMTVQRNDIGELGWQWSIIHLGFGLPFISYSGKRIVWYTGWQPTGFFGVKIILTH